MEAQERSKSESEAQRRTLNDGRLETQGSNLEARSLELNEDPVNRAEEREERDRANESSTERNFNGFWMRMTHSDIVELSAPQCASRTSVSALKISYERVSSRSSGSSMFVLQLLLLLLLLPLLLLLTLLRPVIHMAQIQ